MDSFRVILTLTLIMITVNCYTVNEHEHRPRKSPVVDPTRWNNLTSSPISKVPIKAKRQLGNCGLGDCFSCNMGGCVWCDGSCTSGCSPNKVLQCCKIIKISPTKGYNDERVNLSITVDQVPPVELRNNGLVIDIFMGNTVCEEINLIGLVINCQLKPPYNDDEANINVVFKRRKGRAEINVTSAERISLKGRRIINYEPGYIFYSSGGYISMEVDKIDFEMANIYIGSTKCKSTSIDEPKRIIKCMASEIKTASQVNKEIGLILRTRYNEYVAQRRFQLRTDPRIFDFNPSRFYANIPIEVEFKGQGFSFFHGPKMAFADFFTYCTLAAQTSMKCPIPGLPRSAETITRSETMEVKLESHGVIVPSKLFQSTKILLSPRPHFIQTVYNPKDSTIQFEAESLILDYKGTVELYKAGRKPVRCSGEVHYASNGIYECKLRQALDGEDYTAKFVIQSSLESNAKFVFEMGKVKMDGNLLGSPLKFFIGIFVGFMIVIAVIAIAVFSRMYRKKLERSMKSTTTISSSYRSSVRSLDKPGYKTGTVTSTRGSRHTRSARRSVDSVVSVHD